MNLKTILGWLAVALVAWWVIQNPHAAQHVAGNIGSFITTSAHGLSNLFASV